MGVLFDDDDDMADMEPGLRALCDQGDASITELVSEREGHKLELLLAMVRREGNERAAAAVEHLIQVRWNVIATLMLYKAGLDDDIEEP